MVKYMVIPNTVKVTSPKTTIMVTTMANRKWGSESKANRVAPAMPSNRTKMVPMAPSGLRIGPIYA